MSIKPVFFLVFLALSFSTVFSQVEFEVLPPDYIKTITFRSKKNPGQLPIMKRNEIMFLEFDVLNGEEADYYYTIEHFNYDWTPSGLMKLEFLRGFDNLRIPDYANSFNTYQLYSNYSLQIPNQQTQLLITGNYMIKILNDEGILMFSRKFMVYEESSAVGVAVKRSRDVKNINQTQTIDIKISPYSIAFNNPKQTVKVAILQNNNLNTSIYGVPPQYTIGKELIYKYQKETTFWGGNEYLYFENKNVRGANVGVQFIDLKDIYHSYLFTNIIRADRPYTYNPDVNGNFVITAIVTRNVNIEADYTVVHFSLQHPELFEESDIHIYGKFNNYTIDDETRMNYNPETGHYEQNLTLKQGFYNYKYVIVDKNGNLDEGAISGNFDVTENNYKVLVYYRNLGARYDRLVGLGEASSTLITN
jgi:hypothetical protein